MHTKTHPLQNRIVILNIHTAASPRKIIQPGVAFKVMDWYDRKNGGKSFYDAFDAGDIFAKQLMQRLGFIPDEELVIGHIGTYMYVVHESEMGGIWE